MQSDDLWAYQRMRTHGDLLECTSFRVSIKGIVHRLVRSKVEEQLWQSLCERAWDGYPPSCDQPVNCLGCLAEGA